jgi:parvulin-like peptidyl-prolyl isomerase
MHKALTSILALLALGFVFSSVLAQSPPPATPPAPADFPPPAATAVAATVDGQPIPELAVYRALRPVPADKRGEARGEILNFLVENLVIDNYLKSLNIAVEKKDVDARIDEMRNQLKRQNQDLEKVLKEMLLSADEFQAHITAEVRWDKFVSAQGTEPKLRELLAQNPEMFDGTMVHARHILLSPPAGDARANEEAKNQLLALKKQIEDDVARGLAKLPPSTDTLTREKERAKLIDDAFAAQARQKSACPSKEQGGDLGFFQRSGTMVEPFAKAAFALKPYEVSGVVTTRFGQHLILALERRTGAKELKFDDVKEDVKDVFAGRLRESLVVDLRPKAKIVITPK